jgi:glycosyltransferase involved in cell wall biosynthesis
MYASPIQPVSHYIKHGQKEGRLIRPPLSTDRTPDDAIANIRDQDQGLVPSRQDVGIDRVVPVSLDAGVGRAVAQQSIAELNQPVVSSPAAVQSQELVYSIENKIPSVFYVGKGNYLPVKGWCFSPGHKITDISLRYSDKVFKVHNHSIYRDDVLTSYYNFYRDAEQILHSGFWGLVLFDPIELEQDQSIELVVQLDNGKEISSTFAKVHLIPASTEGISLDFKLDPTEPRVAICMATYNPPLDLFKKQVQSLLDQTFQNWICIISDDHSRADIFDQICSTIGDDQRFTIFRNDDRLGHYYNFEAALRKVPANIDFIAFSDQDDEWYPDKLAKSLSAFESDEDLLVYCDMDVIDYTGVKISNTYWFNRQNNFTSFRTLLYANTVTGAASLFRSNLLPYILPFPRQIGDQYHDHWVACIALTKGNIKYIAEPLYAYNQHRSNAYGIQTKIESHTLFPEFPKYIKHLGNVAELKIDIKETLDNLESSYNFYLLRLILLARMLLLRVGSIPKAKKKILLQLSSAKRTISGLFIHAFGYLTHKGPSLGYEIHALRSYLGHRIRNRIYKVFSHSRINHVRIVASQQMAHSTITPNSEVNKYINAPSNEDGMVRLVKKMIAPLLLDVSNNEPKRINLVMATVDFNFIFGGYLAMFNLAMRIGQFGNRVRIVIVEPCDYQPDKWRRQILAYPGLENLFDLVETSYHNDRNIPLKVNPQDSFIATSCWTAHIASIAAKTLNNKKFIFFAQEYEPIFFAMGSAHALSHQSYFLPQFTIFSTEFLQQYFRNHKIGIYKTSTAEGDANSLVINNAINPFVVSINDISERRKRKFLFYARPEAHAARNLFELGILGLENAIQQGVFSDEWEFYGIGTIGNNRQLPLGMDAN